MAHSDVLVAHVTVRAKKLDHLFDRIVSCHVVLDLAGHHHRHGDRYHVSINIGLPKQEIVVSHTPSNDHELETSDAAVDRAFDEAERQLGDWIQLKRADRHADGRRA
jgi:ribosome-associated translation inhibitor RaiA